MYIYIYEYYGHMYICNIFVYIYIDRYVIPKLKRWAGLYRNADVGALFRRRKHMGLQLTSLELHYQRLQVVKCCLLQSSADANVRAIYEQCKARVIEYNNRWSGPKELANLEPIVEHDFRFAGQHGRAGLGSNKSNPYIANPTEKQRRERIAETLIAQHEEDHIRHASFTQVAGPTGMIVFLLTYHGIT